MMTGQVGIRISMKISGLSQSIGNIPGVGRAEFLRVWLRVALLSFGGPAGQIAVMHRIIVEEKKWISEGRFLHALNYCMLLPGPEAQQLATYIGWLPRGGWALHPAGHHRDHGAQLHLRRLRQRRLCGSAVLRPEGRRACYR